jgi:hypothetical protein
MAIVKDGGILVDEPDEDLRVFIDDPHFIHYLGMLIPPRPGVADCISLLENTYFKPGTTRNDLFVMRIIEWEELTWVMVSIPISDKGLMEKAAQVSGLRVADGVPTMLQGGGVSHFPVSNERVFTLENCSGHPVYQNRHLSHGEE